MSGSLVPRLLLYYHFFRPDDVVSARLFTDLAAEQRRRGWEVTVLTSDRSWRDPALRLPAREDWEGVRIRRVHRPAWDQARPLERLGNSAWMIAAWLAATVTLGRFDAIVVGSDPAFAPLIAFGLRALQPRAALALWSFDLYPEAIEAEGSSRAVRWLGPVATRLMDAAYARYDALVDIGPRMRERLAAHVAQNGGGIPRQETLVPWALKEADVPVAADRGTREALFPGAKLALLYSGTMGRAHDFQAFLQLARACRARAGTAVSFCFSARGNRFDELRAAVGPADRNITFAPFADEAALEARLGAADVHLVSLQPEWAGVVVPSKFFASLAVGRPVLYAGPADSEIARWIAEHDVGLRVTTDDHDAVAARLCQLANDPTGLQRWRENALAAYRQQWSKVITNDRWDALLRELVAARQRPSA